MGRKQFQSYCGDTYEKWEDCGQIRYRRIKKADSPEWGPIPLPLTKDEIIANLRAEVERMTAEAKKHANETQVVFRAGEEKVARLLTEIERLKAENERLSQHVCSECDPEN